MDAELKTKWVEALRSGKYKQGAGYLCLSENGRDKFCCLGVVLDIQGATWSTQVTDERFTSKKCEFGGNPVASNALKSELHRALPSIPEDTIKLLMDRNDGNGMPKWSFAKIADYIEKHL